MGAYTIAEGELFVGRREVKEAIAGVEDAIGAGGEGWAGPVRIHQPPTTNRRPPTADHHGRHHAGGPFGNPRVKVWAVGACRVGSRSTSASAIDSIGSSAWVV